MQKFETPTNLVDLFETGVAQFKDNPLLGLKNETGTAGSVGRPIDDVNVVIDKSVVEDSNDDGEIIVYGPNVMQGYHNKPEETQKCMTADGGFRTGDRGRIDEDGYLFLTGRIKEQYKLQNGKYGRYEIPQKFIFLADDFTLENGMLTQTMKLKRRVVFENYNSTIEELYK